MPIPDNFFDALRLSKNPQFARMNAGQAAIFARGIKELLASEKTKTRLMELGGPTMAARAMSIVDTSTDPKGIEADRARLRATANRGVGTRVGEGFANALTRFGLGDFMADVAGRSQGRSPIGALLNTLGTGEPLLGPPTDGAPITPFGPLRTEEVDFPLLGSQDPVMLAADILANLAPAVATVGGSVEGVAATGLTKAAPRLASTLAFALGGGALEAGRQAIRAVELDEPIDPVQVAIESAVFGAGGVPVGGGFLLRRPAAALISGGAAAAVPALLGREVDPARVAMEAAFGLMMGNPKIDVAQPPPFDFNVPGGKAVEAASPAAPSPAPATSVKPLDPVRLRRVAELVAQKEGIPLAEATKKVETLLRQQSALGKPKAAKAPTKEPAQVTALKEEAAIAEPAQAKILTKRAEAASILSQEAEANLLKLMETASPESQVLIRDALAVQRGEVVMAPDAPIVASTPPPKLKMVEPGLYRTEDGAFEVVKDDRGWFWRPTDPSVSFERVTNKHKTAAVKELQDHIHKNSTRNSSLPIKNLEPKQHGVQVAENSAEYLGNLAKKGSEQGIFRDTQGDPQFMADAVTFKALRRGDVLPTGKPMKSDAVKFLMEALGPEARMRLFISMEDAREAIKQKRLAAKQKALGEVQLDEQAAKRINLKATGPDTISYTPTRKVPTKMEHLRQLIIDEWKLEENDLTIRARLAEADGAPDSLKEQLQKSLELVQSKQAEASNPLTPLEVPDALSAWDMFQDLTAEMNPRQKVEFLRNLPQPLKPFELDLDTKLRVELKEALRMKKLAEKVKAEENAVTNEVSVSISKGRPETFIGPRSKTGKASSLADLKADAAAKGMTLEFDLKTNGFILTAHGADFAVPSLAGARKMIADIDSIAAGDIPSYINAYSVKTAAHRKAVDVEHIGNGEFRTKNMITGEVQDHHSLKEAAQAVVDAPAVAAVDLTPGAPDVPGGGGSIGGAGSEGRFHFDAPEEVPGLFPTTFGRIFGSRGEMMRRMEDASPNIPIWTEVWEPSMEASRLREAFQRPVLKELRGILSPIKPGRRRVVQDLMISGSRTAEIAQHYNASSKEIAAASKLKQWYTQLLDLDPKQSKKFFEEVVPAYRKSGGDPNRAFEGWNLPDSLREIKDEIAKGHINLAEPNAHVLANDVLLGVGRRRYMNPALKRINQLQQFIKQRLNQKGVLSKEQGQLRTMASLISDFEDSLLYGINGNKGESTAAIIRPLMSQLKKWGLIDKLPEARDVDRWASELTSYVSNVALSARPAIAARNWMQRMLVANRVGYDIALDAQKMILTREGKQMVQNSNVMSQQVDWFVDDISTMLTSNNISGAKDLVLRAQNAGMWMYKNADHTNRGHNYLAGVLSIKKYAPLLQEGRVGEFLAETGLALESGVVRRRVLSQLQDVDPGQWDRAVFRAGDEYGKRMVEEFQFIYHRANAPLWMQSIPGRVVGQFGIWPVGFAEMMRRNITPQAMRFGKNVTPKGIASRRWMARFGAQFLAIGAVGTLLGIDTSSYNMANPLSFEGGPVVQVARDMITLAGRTEGEFGKRLALRNATRFLHTFAFPFGGMIEDQRQAMEKTDPMEKVLTMLGFTTKERAIQ